MSWSRTLRVRQSIRAQLQSGEEIAILFSDLRGFTRYTARKGDRAAYELTRTHEEILRGRIDEYGVFVKSLGDGVMAAFETADDAIRAAVAIQDAIRVRNQAMPDEPIDVGIGISNGRPVMTDIDFIGHAVNLAQRLSALAKGGQILVTEKTRDAVRLGDGWLYVPMGSHDIKGLGTEPVVEVAWMKEIVRVSDAADRITLILTERGTIVAELAKDSKEDIRDALRHMQEARAEEDGAFSAFMQRAIARLARRLISASLKTFGIAREQAIEGVHLALHGDELRVETQDGAFRLRGVDREVAMDFVEKARALRGETT